MRSTWWKRLTCMPELHSDLLREIRQHELDRGNSVRAEETAWSAMDLVVRFAQPIDAAFAARLAAGGTAHLFETRDPHYGGELGVVSGRESIVGPRRDI